MWGGHGWTISSGFQFPGVLVQERSGQYARGFVPTCEIYCHEVEGSTHKQFHTGVVKCLAQGKVPR